MTALHPLVSAITQQIELVLGVRCLVRQADTHAFWLLPEFQPLAIAFYLLQPDRQHLDDPGADGERRVIHLDEDQWHTAGALVISRLAALCGKGRKVQARKTVVARIHVSTAVTFQQEHHQQVALRGKYRYGLFADGELVSVAVFSGGRRMHGQPDDYRSFELLRFCHKQGYLVVGGFTKLLKAFIRDFNPGDIMTYADKDWSDGRSYRRTGFISAGSIDPQLFWIHKDTFRRYSEALLPQHIQQQPPGERMKMGYIPVKNSGSLKMVLLLIKPT